MRFFFSLLFVCGMLVMPAGAEQEADIEAVVTVGYAGNIPPGASLVPVEVVLRNDLRNTDGMIEVYQTPPGGQSEVRHLLGFTSPANSVKRFTLYVRNRSESEWRVVIRFSRHFDPIQKVLPAYSSGREALVLGVGLTPKHAQHLNEGTSENYRFVPIGHEQMPENPLALDSIHLVILTSAALTDMSRGRVKALGQWLRTGGRVVFLDPTSDRAFLDQATALGIDDQIDLFTTGIYSCGAGLAATAGRNGSLNAFWMAGGRPIPSYTSTLFPKGNLPSAGNIFSNLTHDQGTYGYKGFLWLALIIGAYILVIGPLDYYICKRSGKPYLTWVIFLSAIVLFSVIAYWYSTLVHSGSMEAVHVNLLDVVNGQRPAKGNAIFWIYSTRNDTYDITTPEPNAAFSARESAIGTGIAKVDIFHHTPPLMQAKIPIFSSKTFDATWIRELDKPLVAEEVENGFRLHLPEGFTAASLTLATADGLTEATHDDVSDTWILEEEKTWHQALEQVISHLNPSYYSYRGNLMPDNLPSIDSLMIYATWLSFAHIPPPPPKDETEAVEPPEEVENLDFYVNAMPGNTDSFKHLANMRSSREQSLSINERLLFGGRVLLIGLTPDSKVLPIDFTRFSVESRTLNLVRLQLPPQP